MSPMPDESRWLVERFYHEVWNRADEATAQEILSPELEFRGSIGDTFHGLSHFVAYVHKIHAAFADYHCRIDDIIAAGDRAAAQMMFSGMHRGSLFGEPPTQRRLSWAGAAFFTIASRKINRIWVLGDTETLKRQLGVL